jgi:putative membrane protein
VSLRYLATVNAALNLSSAAVLVFGYVNIKRGRRDRHKKFMLASVVTSALFLTSYLIYHLNVGSVPFERYDWTRPIYFAVLIPHVTFAGLMTPFILLALWHAYHNRFDRHTRITRWLWPVWIFVSISGVVVYLMLYHL